MRSLVTDLGIMYPDLHPYSVRGWMKTHVDGPNDRFQDLELLYTVVYSETGRRVAGQEPHKTATDAWRVATLLQKAT